MSEGAQLQKSKRTPFSWPRRYICDSSFEKSAEPRHSAATMAREV
jgi:hypothetical protein